MAILQISKITNRKGYQENLPQLAGAEFGWALDSRRLYIGNGAIEDGAPVIGNTEILTEFSNLLESSASYTYKGAEAGYIVSTGDGSDIIRTMQSRLDDTVSIRAFGAIGDGKSDDTYAINRALNQLFCNEDYQSSQVRRSLYFPAGTYIVSDVIMVPPYAKIFGDGLDSTIIKYIKRELVATDISIGVEYTIITTGELGSETNFTEIGALNNDPGTEFVATGVGSGTGRVDETSVADYVIQTSDNLQQIGDNLGNVNGGVIPPIPTGIEMSSMSVVSTVKNSLLLVNSLTKSTFSFMNFKSIMEIADLGDKTANTAAIRIVQTGNYTPADLTFNKCLTSGTSVGLDINDRCKGVQFENSRLEMHYQGVCVGGDGLLELPIRDADYSPTGINISRSIFDQICDAGILFGNVKFNSSGFNVFYNVGNTFEVPPLSPEADPSAIINMHNGDNVSIGDLFERSDIDAEKSPRIEINNTSAIAFDSTSAMFLGAYKRKVGLEQIVHASSGPVEVFTLNSITSSAFNIDYTMLRDNEVRTGSVRFIVRIIPNTVQPAPPLNPIHIVSFDDEYSETQNLLSMFSAVINLNEDRIAIGATVSIDPGLMLSTNINFKYSIVRIH